MLEHNVDFNNVKISNLVGTKGNQEEREAQTHPETSQGVSGRFKNHGIGSESNPEVQRGLERQSKQPLVREVSFCSQNR